MAETKDTQSPEVGSLPSKFGMGNRAEWMTSGVKFLPQHGLSLLAFPVSQA